MRIIIDANVYVSGWIENETHSAVTNNFFEYLQSSPHIVLLSRMSACEVMNVLMRAGSAEKKVFSFIQELFYSASSILQLSSDFEQIFFSFYGALKLKTLDVMILLTAWSEAEVLITWDKILLREGKRIMTIMTPDEFLSKYAKK